MKASELLLLISEILVPIVLAVVAKNNAVTSNAYAELKELKKNVVEDKRLQTEWKIEISSLLTRNDRITERNSRLIEQLIENFCTEKTNEL
jgi:hypothetical protein